ncbi:S-adenosylmethionine:tRNA ribosyltransferase-isomerase [Adlercreutzia equolifaciens]|uniref:S-adenosylmethionine:tRNA ribosyltransferase-isomerase n=1 Tax=Adlercreutzia equolifaciens TaxID=446660 RepID=UPI0023B0F5A0|nr:S-adenosylmethionine:tRNA ribosyltransferase-isomerase [Adlercreutzia equolifaciens]MDE8702854.1 S-adenosylmethionine:tRNA ribosyltransferase-isomerase [Adlercreutzia equolifaciens]
MRTDDFDYNLPEELIAQEPAAVRDECRLLVMDRQSGEVEDRIFRDIIEYLEPGDLLVANETRVMPARLLGAKRGTGGAAEVFLLRECGGPEPRTNRVAFWEVLVRPGKRLKPGSGAVVDFTNAEGEVVLSAEIIDWAKGAQKGERVAKLTTPLPSLDEALHAVGHTPLPPYIKDYAGDEELYQTVYSRRESSAAAPTAGLHFTPQLIERLREAGIGWATVELEVGLDTFRVVDEENPADHVIHTEFYTVPQATVDAVNAAHAAGKRVIAVGTTSVRSLESAWDPTAGGAGKGAAAGSDATEEAADAEGAAKAASADADWDVGAGPTTGAGADAAEGAAATSDEAIVDGAAGEGALVARDREATSLYILPGYQFHVVDALITNFHVPKSTLMMLVSAFSSRENIMTAYQHAIDERYRLLSFGDAMFLH